MKRPRVRISTLMLLVAIAALLLALPWGGRPTLRVRNVLAMPLTVVTSRHGGKPTVVTIAPGEVMSFGRVPLDLRAETATGITSAHLGFDGEMFSTTGGAFLRYTMDEHWWFGRVWTLEFRPNRGMQIVSPSDY